MLMLSKSEILEVEIAIANALDDAFNDLKKTEPQLIANLVNEIPKKINGIKLSHQTKINASGVFVHSRPFVSCKSFPESTPKSVEIGDILLIRRLVVNGNIVENRALLLQAKKFKHNASIGPIKPDNKNQWHLYEKWPDFKYANRSGNSLCGKDRSIKEPDMYDAAKYLLIDIDYYSSRTNQLSCIPCNLIIRDKLYPFSFHMTAQPTNPLGRYRCFFREAVEFILGNSGKIFITPKTGVNGWDQVIDDLINETGNAISIYMGRAQGKESGSKRSSGVLFFEQPPSGHQYSFLYDGSIEPEPNKPTPDVGDWDDSGDNGGISIIEVIVQQEFQ